MDGDQRSVIVVKRVSTCEGVQRYYSHQIIKVEDIDGIKIAPRNEIIYFCHFDEWHIRGIFILELKKI